MHVSEIKEEELAT